MRLSLKLRLEKKHKYLIYTLIVGALLLLYSVVEAGDRGFVVAFTILVVLFGNFLTQYSYFKSHGFWTYLINLLLPLHLIAGAVSSVLFFPNLSFYFRVFTMLVFAVVFYIYLLFNNVFLVVYEKKELIPLYRVAVTWSQIILVIIAIPYFAGIFKAQIGVWGQNLAVATSSLLFSLYMLWAFEFDKNNKQLNFFHKVVLGAFVFFIILVSGVGVSFISTESFLRSILMAVGLMFGLSYLQAHLSNTVTRGMVMQFLFIFLVFFGLMATFS